MTVYLRALTNDGLQRNVAEPFRFPGGEWHLKNVSAFEGAMTWIADVRGASVDDLTIAALLADAAHQRQEPFVLMLPYLPAARADRGIPMGAAVYGSMVRAMNPQQVIGIDPHSPVIERYIPKLDALDPTPLVVRALRDSGRVHYHYVVAPDHGAQVRAARVAAELGIGLVTVTKHRDFETGKITGIEVPDDIDPWANYLVVDDICDGGGTFMGLAKHLGQGQLGLWVTHGIFSGNAPELRKHYQHIYATDSHPGHSRPGCATVIVPAESYMLQNLKDFT